MVETQEMQVQLVSSHVMLAILEVLEGRCSRDVIIKLLQIIILYAMYFEFVAVLVDSFSLSLAMKIWDSSKVSA
jgi:phosphate starvation-inducible membrane PsiE